MGGVISAPLPAASSNIHGFCHPRDSEVPIQNTYVFSFRDELRQGAGLYPMVVGLAVHPAVHPAVPSSRATRPPTTCCACAVPRGLGSNERVTLGHAAG